MIIINKVVLLGRMTKDAELRFAAGTGNAVARFTLAVNRPFKKDETDFIQCVAFGKQAETISQYVTKGQQIAISGSVRTGSYDKQDGTKVYTTDIAVDGFNFVGGQRQEQSNIGKADYQNNSFGSPANNFDDDVTPVNDADMPF